MKSDTKKNPMLNTQSKRLFSLSAYTVLVYFAVFNSAMAHPRHDHTANESMLIHTLLYGSIILAIVAGVAFAYRQLSSNKHKNISKK